MKRERDKSAAPGTILEEKFAATKNLLDVATEIIDLREQMALARQSLAKAQMLILIQPRGYGSAEEYRENCKTIMKSAREIERLAKEWRRSLRKLGADEPSEISEALAKAAEAKSQFSFWERFRF